MEMNRKELIKKYIDFFKSKSHKEISNSPLVPENDSTVLFTTAGMHPLVPFLLGEKHPLGKRLCNVQKCIRTGDIDEVGDEFHLTFFEMLGNWSLGDYFKKDAITWSFEFLTKILKVPVEKLAVTCFQGDENAEKDEESSKIWESLKIKKERIAFFSKKNNWWEHPSKNTPCGPCTEIFYFTGKIPKGNPKTNEKQWAEIGNDVLMQYTKIDAGKYQQAKQKNIDFGGGCERILAIIQGLESVYETSCFSPIIKEIEKLSGKKYKDSKETTKAMRIISDHVKASVMILGEKVAPSNIGRGYVLKRLIRRAIRFGKSLGIKNFMSKLVPCILKIYDDYSYLEKNKKFIIEELEKEEARFNLTLEQGLKVFEKLASKNISGKDAFLLYQSYGFPVELTLELAKEKNIKVDFKEYKKEEEKHQELSRTASSGVFKSGLADSSEATTKLHTANHLLLAALKKVLRKEIEQRGSNINPERLRFDFTFDRKLVSEELKEIENFVNSCISKKIPVKRQEMTIEEAKKSGATGIFEHKYGEKVSVYTIGNEKEIISREICSGPHVSNTSELGKNNKKFKIIKEEASASGIRRIKGVLE